MSFHGFHGGQNSGYSRDRSRSPQRGSSDGRNDRRDNRRDHRRDDRRDDRRGGRDYGTHGGPSRDGHEDRSSRGGRGGYDNYGGRGRDGEQSFVSKLPDVPDDPPMPDNSELIPYPDAPLPRGSLGLQVEVLANHFLLRTLPTIAIFCYDLRFKIPESSQLRGKDKVTTQQMARAMFQVKNILKENFCFDGISLGWSPNRLMPIGEERTATVNMGERKDKTPNIVMLEIRNTGALDLQSLKQFIKTGTDEMLYNPRGVQNIEICLKWLQALLSQNPRATMVTKANSSHFDRDKMPRQLLQSTGGVLEALRGIYQSVVIRFGARLTVNVDTATSVFWTPHKSLIELISSLLNVRDPNRLTDEFNSSPERFFQACSRLLGLHFQVRHLIPESKNSKMHKFVSWSQADATSTTFTEDNDDVSVSTSVFAYFKRKYNINLKLPHLPMCVTSGGAFFPLELCYSTPGELYKGLLKGQETGDLLKFATAPAYIRRQQIMEGVKRLAWHGENILKLHGVSVDTKLLQKKARVLTNPRIRYKSSAKVPENGRWNLKDAVFILPVKIESWVLLYLPRGRPDESRLETLGGMIAREFMKVGIQAPRELPFLTPNPFNIAAMVGDAQRKAFSCFGKVPDLIFILGSDSSETYASLKSALDCDFGIASQVMLEEKALKLQIQYLANISLKVNTKLGGLNHTVDEPLFERKRWCVIGGDLSLPSPSALRLDTPLATVGMTASWDDSCTRFTAVTAVQPASVSNLIINARSLFKELLQRYRHKHNGKLPDSILYLRDGSSESEFDTIKNLEGRVLKELCDESGQKVLITIVLGIKRHHTRFFMAEKYQHLATRLGNVPSGTVVENSPTRNDVFLVAHNDLQGCKRPTRYLSLVDENKLSADDFQHLMLSFCSTYARSTSAVAVASPIYYADQVAQRARLHLEDRSNGSRVLKPVHKNLTYRMWWQ